MQRRLWAAAVLMAVLWASENAFATIEWVTVSDVERAMDSNPLDPGAGAVVLFKRGEISVEERTSNFWLTTMETYVRIKVFNESGLEAASVSVEASRYRRFRNVEGRTILPNGEIIPLDPSKVLQGKSYETGSGFTMTKTSFALPGAEPGAILEYRMTQTSDGYFPPPWFFDTEELGTLESTLSVVVGPRLALAQNRMDTSRSKIDAKQTRVAKGTKFDYSVRNLPPIPSEPYAVPFADQACVLLFSPYEVAFSGSTYPLLQKWNDVARVFDEWYKESLKKSKGAKNKAKELAGELTDERQRAEAIYYFIQQNIASTEYRGVGYIRAADEVLTDRQGDPDEINGLFVTMLREVKIDADPVLVASRDAMSLNASFPNIVQFTGLLTRIRFKNAEVKDPKDPLGYVIADPADPATQFGEVGWYNQGIVGVAVNGGKAEEALIPIYPADSNVVRTQILSELQPDGAVESSIETSYQGADARSIRRRFHDESTDKIEQAISDYLDTGLPESEFSDIEIPDFKDTARPTVLKTKVRFQLVEESGPGQLLLNPWVAERSYAPAFTSSERKSAVRFDFPKVRVSTSTWKLPEGASVEELPEEVAITNDLGEFTRSCAEQDGGIRCERKFVLRKMDLQTNLEYMQAKQFFEQVAKHDQEVILLNLE